MTKRLSYLLLSLAPIAVIKKKKLCLQIEVFLGIGGNIPMFEKDIFQVLLFGNYGFTQIYSGNFAMNGMAGRNLLAGIQISYLIGKPSIKGLNTESVAK